MKKSTKNNVKEDINHLISKSFPMLKKNDIIIKSWGDTGKIHPMACSKFTTKNLVIEINPQIKKLNKKERLGLLAHELVHLEDYARRNYIKNIFWLIKDLFYHNIVSIFYPKIKDKLGKEHKKVDIRAINKGYKTHLIAYRRFIKKHLDKKKIVDFYKAYLSEKEIKGIKKENNF